jgi:hypothetical protein
MRIDQHCKSRSRESVSEGSLVPTCKQGLGGGGEYMKARKKKEKVIKKEEEEEEEEERETHGQRDE